jgi:chemotaxis protein methyltransferase CheR
MRLSHQVQYAICGVFDLAYNGQGGPVQIRVISERQGIPPRYLEQIFHRLRRAGLVRSKRGPGGGYTLARQPAEITLHDVVVAVEGPLEKALAMEEPGAGGLPLRPDFLWGDLAGRMAELLDETNLDDLCRAAARADSDPPLDDRACVEFLRWALPRLHLRWRGFRRVRRQVRRRLARRLGELGLPDLDAYRGFLAGHEAEWEVLDGLCRVTISRFQRDRAVWDALRAVVLPELARARGEGQLSAWSAGCASGEEPCSLMATWQLGVGRDFPGLSLRVLATDIDPQLVDRARVGEYPASSVRDFPAEWLDAAFEGRDGCYRARPVLREGIELRVADLRGPVCGGPFDLILCRNLAFTYFDEVLQRQTAARLAGALAPGGGLVIGSHESLPAGPSDLSPWLPELGIHRRGLEAATPGPPSRVSGSRRPAPRPARGDPAAPPSRRSGPRRGRRDS